MTQEVKSALFHTRYRPETFERMIGHEQAVTRVKGIIAKGNWPSAMLMTGAPSAGKTTLARCIATAINGKSIAEQVRNGTYREIDGGSQRTIDDMRELIQNSRHKPMGGGKRIFVIDEAQSILTNKPAAQALLKPIEDSGTRDTIWILCSMDPGKFQTTTEGKAIAGRCTQFVLPPHTQSDLMKMAKRIVVGEEMTYMKDSELLTKVVERAGTMREIANQLQAISEYYEGLEKKPKKLDEEALMEVLTSIEGNDDAAVATILSSALVGKFTQAQLAILDIGDSFQAINKMVMAANFMLNMIVLNGKKHPKLIWAPVCRMAWEKTKGQKIPLGHYAGLLETTVQLKNESMDFTVDAGALISQKIYRYIKNVVAPAAAEKKD